jgi:hypothetical protein
MNEKRTKPIAKNPDKKWVEKPQKPSFEDKNWEEPEEMARIAPINKDVYIDVEKIKTKSKSPVVSENYGIDDPELLAFYKTLNEIQQGIVKKMPTKEDKIRFLNFAKEAKEKEAAKLAKMNSAEKDEYFKKKEMRKEERMKQRAEPKKKTSSPIEEFLKDKKFTPEERTEIAYDFNAELNKELLELASNPPAWPKNDGWDSPGKWKQNSNEPVLGWDGLPLKTDWGEVFGKDPDEENEEEEAKQQPKKLTQPQIEFEKIVNSFYGLRGRSVTQVPELEVRFGTRGISKLTKNDYDNVIQKLKSLGFTTYNPDGLYSLRIQCEFIEQNSGKMMLSPIRTEIEGSENIQKYCNNNSISELLKTSGNAIKFNKKTNVLNNKGEKVWPVNFDDFNFRVSLQNEEILRANKGAAFYIIDKWKDSKKTFRYLNRVTFRHPDYPILVDISITKSTELVDKKPKTYYSTTDSNIFNREETYEIELEVDNKSIDSNFRFNSPQIILESLRKVIKFVFAPLKLFKIWN